MNSALRCMKWYVLIVAQLRAPKVVLTVIYKKYHQRIFGSCQSNLQFLSTDFEDLVDKIFQKSLQLQK